MKRVRVLGGLGLLLIVLVAVAFLPRNVSFADGACPPCELWVQLIGGQNTSVGSVQCTVVGTDLVVIYRTTGDWVLTETHVAVATDPDSIPQTRSGNPKIGMFPYQEYHDPPVAWYTYTIPMDEIIPGFMECDPVSLAIATHAVVQIIDPCTGDVLDEETAWSCGDQFRGRSWAMYHLLVCP